MPVYKKRRVVAKKRVKRSYAMVPRPRINGELVHRHIVTCSTSSTAQVIIRSPATGISDFAIGGSLIPASPNMSFNFSLAQVVLNLGGVPALTIPVPNVAELQQLYDTFQIEKVELTIFAGNTDSLVSGDPTSGIQWVLPLIGHSVDTDDDGNTSLTQLQQYSTYKMDQLGQKPIKATMVPCVAGNTFGGGFTRLQRQDINVAQAATPHYGYKLAVDGFRATPNGNNCLLSFMFRTTYLMKCTR